MAFLGGWPVLDGSGSLIPAVHGAGDGGSAGWVGLLDSLLDSTTRFFDGGSPFEFLPGLVALAPNIHPLLVHFPIAFLNAFFLLDLIAVAMGKRELRMVASWMLYLGTLGAASAAAAGLYAASFVPHGEAVHEILEWHERLGLTVTSLALGLSLWRLIARYRFSGMANVFHLFLAGIMVTAMFFGADLGGLMVYQHGVGVKNLQSEDAAHHHEHGGAESW
ncbi:MULTISPECIES: DUF2231 domain-containing protein [Methylococcus]|uniref:DUF2231 domain-containing protein n=1 Tax=Methylococcus capsulatus TaxID=414 RepID=A0ABZ2F3I2_METCP|nr:MULTISPECIES: DUF2231 domain-containing protein [Methylococcus]MDF9392003.1 DUF2231 domain-containing protein [Methylococcus capsulatus]